jgi:hypothetical protein
MQVHSHLALDGVHLLLARVPAVSFLPALPIGGVWTLRTLHSLLEAVNHHPQLRQLAQQLIEVAAVLTTWVRHLHGVLTRYSKHREHTMQQARYRTVGYSKQEAEHLMSGVQTQPHDRKEYLLLKREGEGVSATHSSKSEAVGSLIGEPLVLGNLEQWTDIFDKSLKLAWSQARQGVEHVRMKL